jgi:hypothetical protein
MIRIEPSIGRPHFRLLAVACGKRILPRFQDASILSAYHAQRLLVSAPLGTRR